MRPGWRLMTRPSWLAKLALTLITAAGTVEGSAYAAFPGGAGAIAVQHSPDSRALTSAIGLLDWRTGEVHQLTWRGIARSPAVSPDGQWIAYVSNLPRGHINVWAIRSDGSRSMRLTKGHGELAAESPTYSADGQWVAFTAESGEGGRGIDKVSASGGHRRVLVPAVGMQSTFSPSYSADGQSLAWVRSSERIPSPARIYVGRSNGREGKPVTTGVEPEFSPDGKSLVFTREGRCRRGWRTVIAIMSLSTRQESALRSACGNETPSWQPLPLGS
jgi:Tol biopolymer transport system component